ncbi:MAG TPA: dTDP-4-dehydrorhamnose reductase [Terriglobales bacterium]|nr:dTDP-4-dehydrorhamnose reductase [Terriglobales bacterium]
MRVAVIGANGQLGHDVWDAFASAQHEVLPLTHTDLEIDSADSVMHALEGAQADVVVNTAAFHNVEKCESEPGRAFAVNALGARNVAMVTEKLGAAVIHISTDYVFDGAKNAPYIEDDAPLPLSVYGNSKLAGEYFVSVSNPRHFVLRVSAIYGLNPCRAKGGMNFVETMLKLAKERDQLRVVNDEFVSPTPAAEIARQVVALSATQQYGLYHATSEGSCSWFEFAQAIFELTGTKVKLEAARPGEFSAKVRRPKYSVLENAALKRKGLNVFSHWRKGLEAYLASRNAAPQPVVTG